MLETRFAPMTEEDLDIFVSKVGTTAWPQYRRQDQFDAMVIRSSVNLFASGPGKRHFNSVAGFIAYGINEGLEL